MKRIEEQLICRFGGGGMPTIPGPPAPPSKDQAALAAEQNGPQGKQKKPMGYNSTILTGTRAPQVQPGGMTLLGGGS
jgi:hypothetical protein